MSVALVRVWLRLRPLLLLSLGAALGSCTPAQSDVTGLDARTGSPSHTGVEAVDIAPPRHAASEHAFDVEVGDGVLAGVLSLPERAVDETVPALVLLHGSGRMGRDGEMLGQLGMQFGFQFASYRLLAHALRDQGIAVLRYDKRGVTRGESAAFEHVAVDGTTVEFEADAIAAVRAASAHGAIDARAVFVAGHSQGGQLVPWVLSKSPGVAGGILLSAPHGSIDETLTSQSVALRRLLLEAGHPPSEALAHAERLRRLAEQISLLNPPDLDGEIAAVDKVFWFRWRLMSGGAPWLAARLHQPLLVIAGGNDHNVGGRDFQLWKRTLSTSKVAHEFARIDCMTHALNCLQRQHEGGAEATRHLAPKLADGIAAFVRAHRTR